MTDLVHPSVPEPVRVSAVRHDAFRAAGRHTSHVRLLRRLMAVGSVVGLVGVLGFAFFNPFRKSIPSVSIESLGLDGTTVTMDKPKLSGFKSDGRPYTLNARQAVQDARTPSILELIDLDANVTLPDKSVAHVVSSSGVYDSSHDTMTFHHEVRLTTDAGVDVHMASGYVEMKSGVVSTEEPLTVVMKNSTVTADSMHVTDNGKAMSFEGHVHTTMSTDDAAAKTASNLKGSTP